MPRRKPSKPTRYDAARLFDTSRRDVIEDRVAYLMAQGGLSRTKAEKQATQEWTAGTLTTSTFGT